MNLLSTTARRSRSLLRRLKSAVGQSRPETPPVLPAPRVVKLQDLRNSAGEKYVVFFAPEAGIVPHYVSQCVVAKTLQERGHRVLIVRCFDVYPRCVFMDSLILPQQISAERRREACNFCRRAADDMASSYGLDVIDLVELVDDGVRATVEGLMKNAPANIAEFEIDGIRLGQICGAEASISFKSMNPDDPAVQALLVQYLRGALLSYYGMQRLIDTGVVGRVVHFNEYVILLAAAFAAQRSGIPSTMISMPSVNGVDRSKVVFFPESSAIISYRNRLRQWNSWRDLPLPKEAVREVVGDSLFRMSGNSIMVYSSARNATTNDLFERLDLSPDRRLLVAFTSSLDEVASNTRYLNALGQEGFSEKQPFKDQVEWLTALIGRVEQSPDLQLVVRVHPREGANRREDMVSPHLAILRRHFSENYKHVRVVWPGDAVSSYDLMEIADVGLSAWSSTALEMARFGIPSVIAFDRHTPLPVGDVVVWAPTAEGYFRLVEEAVERRPDLDHIRYSLRWAHLHYLGCAVDLGDVITDRNMTGLPEFKIPKAADVVEAILIGGHSSLDMTRERLRRKTAGDAAREEHEAILSQLRRSIWFFCLGEDRAEDYRLLYVEGPIDAVPAGVDAVLSRDGHFIEFRTRGAFVRRRSRMVQRLGALAANALEQLAVG